MKKYLYKLLYPVARLYWSIFHPVTLGVRVMIVNHGQVLLVRHTYLPGQQWMMPGGGVGFNETYHDAAIREINEELNIKIRQLNMLGVFTHNIEGKQDNVIFFSSTDQINPAKIKIDPNEIIECRFWPIDKLPPNISRSHRRRILSAIKQKVPQTGPW